MRLELIKCLMTGHKTSAEPTSKANSACNNGLFGSIKVRSQQAWMLALMGVVSSGLLLQSGCGQATAPVAEPPKTQVEAPKELGPVETFQAMQTRLAEGDMVAIWDTLPTSYQKDINSLMQEFAGKMDPEIWNQVFAAIGKLQTVGSHKQEIIAKMMSSEPQFAKPEDANFALEQALSIVASLNNDKINKLEQLKSFDGAVVVKSTLNPLFAALMKLYDKFDLPGEQSASPSQFLKNINMELVSIEGDKAVVKMTNNSGEPSNQTLVKVEGKWIPEDLQKGFAESISEAKKSIASMTPESLAATKQQVTTMVTMINSTLDTMDKAETPEQLQGAATGLMVPMMMMGNKLMMGAPTESEPEPKSESTPEPEQKSKPKSTSQP